MIHLGKQRKNINIYMYFYVIFMRSTKSGHSKVVLLSEMLVFTLQARQNSLEPAKTRSN